jgi:hypothetical protein
MNLIHPFVRLAAIGLLLMLAACGGGGASAPAPGTVVGAAGRVDTVLSENATANGIALQADGKLVVVGTRALSVNPNFTVARYGANGALHSSFGKAGTLSIDFFGFEDIGENALVQPDGKIVVGGLARINP